ncbi:MAG: type II toxin-antitoxin system VapC family toxin [Stenotrophobium sp.]
MIVLDTHALLWWVTGDGHFSSAARAAVKREQAARGQVLVSAITAWEIAMLVERGRLTLTMGVDEWLLAVESIECVSLVPVTPRVAVQATRLPGEFHKDPADRLIVALAREFNAPLVTADGKIRGYQYVKCIW